MKKKKNLIIEFLGTLLNGIKSTILGILNLIGKIITGLWQFFVWFWEEALTFLQWLLHIIGTIIDRFGKFFLWIWGFLLATLLIGAIIFWIISIGIKNVDSTNSAQKFLEKSENLIEMKVNFVEAMFQYHLKKTLIQKQETCNEMEDETKKEDCLADTEKFLNDFIQ